MSESYSPENLSPFEAQLASLLPGTAGLNRDQIMFQAGQSDARRQHLQSLRRWQTLSAVLLAATAAQWSLAPWGTSPTSSNQLVSQWDEAMPSQRDVSSSLPGGSHEDAAQGVGGQTPEENEAIDVERDRSRSVGLSAPSSLVREGDVPREVDAKATTRDPRTPGSGLTVGSWPTLARNEPSTFSPVASGFLSPPQTSRELLVELSRY